MPSRILSIPFVIAAIVLLFINFETDGQYAVYLIPVIFVLAGIYILSPQINWWWYQRHPPDVAGKIRELFFKYPFYQRLPEGEKKRFRNRVALFIMGNNFMMPGIETIPEDIKAIAAANAVTLTLGQENFLFPKFENVILHPKPMPTLQYPEKYHTSEIYEPDGVVLFSIKQLVRSFVESKQYFNIGLYEYAKVFVLVHQEYNYPIFNETSWEALERISGFSKEWIEQWINLPDIDPMAVSIAHFFTFPEEFMEELPSEYEAYRKIFKM